MGHNENTTHDGAGKIVSISSRISMPYFAFWDEKMVAYKNCEMVVSSVYAIVQK